MINKAIVVGRLGRDPEKKATSGDKVVCTFSVATTEKYNGEKHTTWHNIVAWGKLAEICGEYLKKGSLVYVEGKISNREYEKDGEKKRSSEIVASSMTMLGSKSEDKPASSEPGAGLRQATIRDDDIPF